MSRSGENTEEPAKEDEERVTGEVGEQERVEFQKPSEGRISRRRKPSTMSNVSEISGLERWGLKTGQWTQQRERATWHWQELFYGAEPKRGASRKNGRSVWGQWVPISLSRSFSEKGGERWDVRWRRMRWVQGGYLFKWEELHSMFECGLWWIILHSIYRCTTVSLTHPASEHILCFKLLRLKRMLQ